jgi:hypothetical protein
MPLVIYLQVISGIGEGVVVFVVCLRLLSWR